MNTEMLIRMPQCSTRDVCRETVSPEGTFCDTVQIPSSVGDMELI